MHRFVAIAVLLMALLVTACAAPAAAPAPAPETEGDTTTTQTDTTTTAPMTSTAATDDAVAQPTAVAGGSRLEQIRERGNLVCGYNGTLPGFGSIDSAGVVTGFDADFCRAIAAAIFNDPEAVEWRPLSAQERFTALQAGEVDVLIRNTTYSLDRDTSLGLDFAPVTFFDGQGMMVRADSGITALEDMDGATICVQSGTTTELNLADNFRQRGLEFTPVVFSENDQVVAAYDAGQCDGFTTDKSGLVSSSTKLTNPEEHVILDVTMSKEPLAPSVLQGDAQWADVVRWVVYATFQAEEFGITQANIGDFTGSEDPNIQRFMGEGEATLGNALGLENTFAVNVITAVGNYGEIYDRNLGPDTPFNLPRGQNSLYTEPGGLLYSPPFR